MSKDPTRLRRPLRKRGYSELMPLWKRPVVDYRYGELRHRTTQLQDALIQELSKHIDVIIKAKEHTSNSLKGLRTFAESH